MWQKIKGFFRTIFSSKETISITQIVVSTYYLCIGLLLAIASNSLVFLLVFALPAIIWWTAIIAHTYTNDPMLEPTSA